MRNKILLSYDAPEVTVILINENDVITTSVSGDDMDSGGWDTV